MKNRIVRDTLISLFYLALVPVPALAQDLSVGVAIGPGVPRQRMSVQNLSGYYCAMVADGKVVTPKSRAALLQPGGTIYDLRRSQTNWQQIPTAALCFRDSGAEDYVGVAIAVFSLNGDGWGSTNAWVFTNADILAFGTGGKVADIPPRLSFSEEKVKFPKEAWDGLSVLQVINNSHFTVRIEADGRFQTLLAPGGWYILHVRGAYDRIPITIIAVPNGTGPQRVRFVRDSVYAQYYNIVARNLVLDDNSFRER